MNGSAILKLILIILEKWDTYVKNKTKKTHKQRIVNIKRDPIGEWNKRFKRVQLDSKSEKDVRFSDPELTRSDRESDNIKR